MTKISMTIASVLMMVASAASANTTLQLEDTSIAADDSGAGWVQAQVLTEEGQSKLPTLSDSEKTAIAEPLDPGSDDDEGDTATLEKSDSTEDKELSSTEEGDGEVTSVE